MTQLQEEETKQYPAQILLCPSQETFQCTNNPSAQAQRSTVAQWQVRNLNRQLRGKDLSIYTLCVHVAAGNTSSALLLVESGNMELWQPCISWAVRSNRTYFSPTSMAIYFHFSTSKCNFRTEKKIRKYFKMLEKDSKRDIRANKPLHTLCLAF